MDNELHQGFPPPPGLVPDGMRVIRYVPYDGAVTWYDEWGDTIVCHYLEVGDNEKVWPRLEPEQWRPVDGDPDLEVGVVARKLVHCDKDEDDFFEDEYDDWRRQWKQVAIRLRRASKRIRIDSQETMSLSIGRGVDMTLLNWVRKAQTVIGCPEDKCAVCPYRLVKEK
jgi:hypothetical protein